VITISLFTSWMHLGDEVLAGTALQQHLLQQSGDERPLLSPAARAHLADCPRCLARLDDLRVTLDEQRQGAADLADARFPQARLDAQRTHILARLAERHAGARVLMFPTATVPTLGHLPRPQQPGMRWIAATLAAGLFVGLATAQVLYTHDRLVRRITSQQAAAAVPRILRQGVRWEAISGPDAQPGEEQDDRLLGEIESALATRRRNPALRALDDLTPRAPGNEPRSRRYRER
jgi:hypothetical protein